MVRFSIRIVKLKYYISNIKKISCKFCHIFLGYRRSHRPSLYDISVMDENKMRRDPELQNDLQTIGNTNANAHNNFLTVPK